MLPRLLIQRRCRTRLMLKPCRATMVAAFHHCMFRACRCVSLSRLINCPTSQSCLRCPFAVMTRRSCALCAQSQAPDSEHLSHVRVPSLAVEQLAPIGLASEDDPVTDVSNNALLRRRPSHDLLGSMQPPVHYLGRLHWAQTRQHALPAPARTPRLTCVLSIELRRPCRTHPSLGSC
jgi:hypothetical protein